MSEEEKHGRNVMGKLAILFLFLLSPFLPLILAFIENFAFKSNRVEGFCRDIGIHDELSLVYEPIIEFLMGW